MYAREECIERRRRFKLGGSESMSPHKILKFRVSEMQFPRIAEEHFNE